MRAARRERRAPSARKAAGSGAATRASLGAVLLLGWLALPAIDRVMGFEPAQVPQPGASPASTLESRLAALDPSDPQAYLLLAEEVQAWAASDLDRRLARELYGLAGALDPARYGASAALGQASLADSASDRARLLRLAVALSGRPGRPGQPAEVSQAAVRFAHLLAAYRRGDGPRARELLARPEVAALVEVHSEVFEGGAEGFRNAVAALRERPIEHEHRRLESMFLEQALLAGGGFSADLLRSGVAPMAAADPLDPASAFGVDAARAWWRAGRWTELSVPPASSQP